MSSSSGVEFVDMTCEVVFFPQSPSLCEVVVKVQEVLGWSEPSVALRLQGRYDAGGSRSYTQMIPIKGNDEWELYKELVDNSEIKSLVIVAVKVDVTGRKRGRQILDLNKPPSVIGTNNDGPCEHDAGRSQPPEWENDHIDNEAENEMFREHKLKGVFSAFNREAIIEETFNVKVDNEAETEMLRKEKLKGRAEDEPHVGLSALTREEIIEQKFNVNVDHEASSELLRKGKLKGVAEDGPRALFSHMTRREEIIEEKLNVANLGAIDEEFVAASPIHIPIPPFVPEVASSELDGDPYTFEEQNPEDEAYEHAYASDSDEDREEYEWSVKETDAFVKVWGRDPRIHEFKELGRLT